MLNAEKYKDEILRIAMSDFTKKNCIYPYCYALGNLSKKTTTEEAVEWLLSEYEPDLLENGDGLKTGNFIMVRNDEKQDWVKRMFAYYYNGIFYCSSTKKWLTDGANTGWNYARLPEEGE